MRASAVLALALAAFLLPPAAAVAQEASGATTAESAYSRENRATFSTFTLSNGIPVYLKRSTANRVMNLTLVLRGGSLAADPKEAGWENLAFKTMARGSTLYPYESLTALLDETSSSISSSTAFEYSTYSLNALDKYFARLVPVWASTLTSPGFTAADFDQARSDAELALQSREQDPWARTAQLMNETYFAGHPYGIVPEGTASGLAAASPAALKYWRDKYLSADRMFVVAVGDLEPGTLRPVLEAALGGIPDLGLGPVPSAPPFPRGGKGKLVTEVFEQSRGTAYLRGDFAAPAPGAPDHMALNVAMNMFSDLLFAVVRDKYGAVYTPSAYIRAFGANYGSISIYKTSATAGIKSYIDEAAGLLASGRCVSVDPARPGEEAKFMKVEDALPAYKAMYTNAYFEAVRTGAAIAGLMVRSVVASGDPADWLGDAARIEAVTPEALMAAFRSWVLEGGVTWVAVGDAPTLQPLVPADFGAAFK